MLSVSLVPRTGLGLSLRRFFLASDCPRGTKSEPFQALCPKHLSGWNLNRLDIWVILQPKVPLEKLALGPLSVSKDAVSHQ